LVTGTGSARANIIVACISTALVPIGVTITSSGRAINITGISIIVSISIPVIKSISIPSVESTVISTVPAISPTPIYSETKTTSIAIIVAISKVIDSSTVIRIRIVTIRIPTTGIYPGSCPQSSKPGTAHKLSSGTKRIIPTIPSIPIGSPKYKIYITCIVGIIITPTISHMIISVKSS